VRVQLTPRLVDERTFLCTPRDLFATDVASLSISNYEDRRPYRR
jgi:hypothetical protein